MATKKLPYQDKAGNWRDAKGRFTKLRPSADKKKVIFKDKKGRWHAEKGGFTKLRPALEKVERVKVPRDIAGRFAKRPAVRVVEEYIEPEPEPYIPPEKPERPARVRVPVFHRQTGDPRNYSEGERVPLERFMNTSKLNREDPTAPTRLGQSRVQVGFEQSFVNKLQKSPLEADEVSIYRYGIMIRPESAETWNTTLELGLQDLLSEYPNSSLHIIDEGQTFAIRINLGSQRRGSDADDVGADLADVDRMLGDLYYLIEQEYGKSGWFAFWDTDLEIKYE